jgi:hypothetical protein
MYPDESHPLSPVIGSQARGPGRDHICAACSRLNEAGVHVAILAGFLRVARRAGCILHARKELVFPHKIGPIVLLGPKGCEIGMTRFACVRRFVAVMARHALGHFGNALLSRKSHFVKALVAGLARGLLVGDVKLMVEKKFTLGVFKCSVGGNVVGRMAIGAVVGELLLVTALAIGFLCQEVVGGDFARGRSVMAILACDPGILDVKLVREFDELSAVLVERSLTRLHHKGRCNDQRQHGGKYQ